MKNKFKKITVFTLIFAFVMSISIFAKTIYDMQNINKEVVKPTSNFMIEYERPNGDKGTLYANDRFYDSSRYSFDQKPNSVTLEYGSKIKIVDLSEPGDGTKINWYDFQMYTPTKDNLIYTKNKSDFEKTYMLNESGNYSFYLSVMDNNPNVNGYDNWSINGNHRWLSENRNNKSQMFYWYFSQADVYVLGKDEEIIEEPEEPIKPDEPIKPEEPDEPIEDEEINTPPSVDIISPKILYPIEITSKGKKENIIIFRYYDDEGDKMDACSYDVFNITHGKVLVDTKDMITTQRDMYVYIEGEMNEEFQIDVLVCDSEGNVGKNSIKVKIDEMFPDARLENNDRTYLDDDLDIEIKRYDDEVLLDLILNYEKYKIYDENKNILMQGSGKIPSKINITNEKYKEDHTYYIEQVVSNSYGTKKTLKNYFYVVPIEKPLVTLQGKELYYGESVLTNCEIMQPQSRLKGNLRDYKYDFKDSDVYYEIYDYENNKLIYKSYGVPNEFKADISYNINEYKYDKTYKLCVYATNDRGKTGSSYAYYIVKQNENDFLKVKILERDNDPSTNPRMIYKDESLLIETKYHSNTNANKKCFILDEFDNVIYEYDDYINGLMKIDLMPGNYKIKCTLEGKETIYSEDYFTVMNINKPVIVINEVNDTYTKLDTVIFDAYSYDVNKSEEHPYGFDLKNEFYINENKYDGNLKEIKLSNYDYGNINVIQKSINEEHNEVDNEVLKQFELVNINPIIETNIKDKYYVGEKIIFDVLSYDEDGYITDFNASSDIDFEEQNNITFDSWNKTIELVCTNEGIYRFSFNTKDDYGKTIYKDIYLNVINSNFYPYLNILNNEKERMKENRYMRINCGAYNADSYSLSFEGNEIILNNIYDVFENENLKMILEDINGDEKYYGLYFKNDGNYSFVMTAKKNGFIDITRTFDFKILEDELPTCIIDDSKVLYRDASTNKANLNSNIKIHTDDEIDKCEVYVCDEYRTDLDNYNDLNFTFNKNELGDKTLKIKVKEKHNYLPNNNHPFYSELINRMKSNYSNVMNIKIENVKPKITFESKTNTYKLKFIN